MVFATRLLSAVVGVPLMLALLYWGAMWQGGWPFFVVVAAAVIIGMREFYVGASGKDLQPIPLIGYAAALVYLFAVWFAREEFRPGLMTAAVVIAVAGSLAVRVLSAEIKGATASVGVTVAGFLYVACLFSFMLRLRQLDLHEILGRVPEGGFRAEVGVLFLVIAATWLLDTGAYGFGKSFGSVKMAPTLSPNKTLEGAIGGLATAVVVATLVSVWLRLDALDGVVMGLLIGVAGQLGDLSESVFKRDMGLKDFGSMIPGHGGVLDRFDSLLFAMPVVYWCFSILVP
ncbi:MAG: phosphatidate cytidylyltransferase [Armatimonadota bacterium]